MSEQNHRILFVDRGEVELESCPIPSPAAGQLLIQTQVSLISPGTERAWFLGLPNTPATYPQTAGYSNIGQVVQVGAGVDGWSAGDRVASAANHVAFAAVDAATCVPVPAGLPAEEAVFFNLASIAMQGVRKARVELGEPVVVIGGGLIGLMAVQLARLSGAVPAIVVDKNPGRLEFAELAGADAALVADQQLEDRVASLCGGDGAAVVIEATGFPNAILSAFALARPGGRVVLLGSTRGETEQVNFYRDVHKKGLAILGAHDMTRPRVDSAPGWWTQRDDQRTALALLAARRLAVQPLITHRFGWRDAVAAYELLKQWDLNALGMVLNWQP